MPTTDDQYAWAQSWIGSQESRASFDDRYDRYVRAQVDFDEDRALWLAVDESLRAQIQANSTKPSQVTLPGGLSVGFTGSFAELRKTYEEFTTQFGVRQVQVVQLVRDPDR